MRTIASDRRLRLAIVVLAALLPDCGLAPLPTQWTAAAEPSDGCDERLWGHTYFAEDRLTTIAHCVVVTGIVRDVHLSDDADLVIELATDPRLINGANVSGWLKVEAVCQGAGTQRKHRTACQGYPGPWFLHPRPGTMLRVTGRYVVDRSHGGHMEIHPASRIDVID